MNTQTDMALPRETEGKQLSQIELDSIIKRYLKETEQLKGEIKEQKSAYDAIYEQDASYTELAEKVKVATRAKTARKQMLLKDPAAVIAEEKLNTLKEEYKDAQEALSQYLKEYERVTGSRQIETEQGEILEIVHVVKLVRRRE